MKTTKTKAGHVQVIMDMLFFSLMRAACIKQGGHNLCLVYLYDTRLEIGEIKGKPFTTKCEHSRSLCFSLLLHVLALGT